MTARLKHWTWIGTDLKSDDDEWKRRFERMKRAGPRQSPTSPSVGRLLFGGSCRPRSGRSLPSPEGVVDGGSRSCPPSEPGRQQKQSPHRMGTIDFIIGLHKRDNVDVRPRGRTLQKLNPHFDSNRRPRVN